MRSLLGYIVGSIIGTVIGLCLIGILLRGPLAGMCYDWFGCWNGNRVWYCPHAQPQFRPGHRKPEPYGPDLYPR
jgi:hypothetical protein